MSPKATEARVKRQPPSVARKSHPVEPTPLCLPAISPSSGEITLPLNMQRVAQRLERCFLERFALRRMRVDGAGDIL
jgi:hypothetical protein